VVLKRPIIGLACIPPGKDFCCADCEYFDKKTDGHGICENPEPKLKGRMVSGHWCCDYFDCSGMIKIEE
jgi:hypothetical protein